MPKQAFDLVSYRKCALELTLRIVEAGRTSDSACVSTLLESDLWETPWDN